MSGPDAIAAAFSARAGRAALMPYLMGGYPDQATSLEIGHAYADGGADLVELGVPFSDPLADGPVIHAAGTAALAAGATVHGILQLARELSERLPVVVMVYANLVYARGLDRFCAELAEHGASGLIVPDVPLEEAPALQEAARASDIALVPLVAPTTPDERLAEIGARAEGFLYTVSVTGTTGEREGGDPRAVIERARAHTPVPVALGFGIARPEHAAVAADAGADGVIVGTRLVRAAGEGGPSEVRELVEGFAAALR